RPGQGGRRVPRPDPAGARSPLGGAGLSAARSHAPLGPTGGAPGPTGRTAGGVPQSPVPEPVTAPAPPAAGDGLIVEYRWSRVASCVVRRRPGAGKLWDSAMPVLRRPGVGSTA